MSFYDMARLAAQAELDADPTKIPAFFDPREQRITGITAHGNIPIDCPVVTEVAENLWVGGCEDGLILPPNIEHLLSLYKWEKYTVNHELKSSRTVTMYDSLDQAMDQVEELAEYVNEKRKDGVVLVHCQAGLNRSGLVTARALMLTEGLTAQEAIDLLRSKRSPAVLCNDSFVSYLYGIQKGLDEVGDE